jgi:soluble lytic murein transglycosylase-like protein
MSDNTKYLLLGLGALALLLVTGVIPMGSQPWTSLPNYQTWAATIAAAEQANGLPTGLLAAIGYQESGYQSAVIEGTQASSAGALGMMQLMPQFFTSVRESIPFTPSAISAQISQAAQQLATLYRQFGNWQSAVAAYNAGAGTVQDALASGGAFPAETQAYLANVSSYVPAIAAATAAGAAAAPTGPTGATGAGTGATGSSA